MHQHVALLQLILFLIYFSLHLSRYIATSPSQLWQPTDFSQKLLKWCGQKLKGSSFLDAGQVTLLSLYKFTLSSMTAVTRFSLSKGDPTLTSFKAASSLSLTLGHMDWGTYMREHAEHFWPLYSKAERRVPMTTLSMSADLCTECMFFPPHSVRQKANPSVTLQLTWCWTSRNCQASLHTSNHPACSPTNHTHTWIH